MTARTTMAALAPMALGLALTLAPGCQPMAFCETPAKPADRAANLTFGQDPNKANEPEDLDLTLLRDCGLSLAQIRQQARNIYQEATRKRCDTSTPFEIIAPIVLTQVEPPSEANNITYLKPRAQWIVYYVGTIEPIISLFRQDVEDTKTGITKITVPEDAKDEMAPIWQEWTVGIAGLDKEVTEISNLIDSDKPENVALAKHAIALFKVTQDLEQTRHKAYDVIKASQLRNSGQKKVKIQ